MLTDEEIETFIKENNYQIPAGWRHRSVLNELLTLRALVRRAEDKVINCGCDDCLKWFEDFNAWASEAGEEGEK